jgi:hypothetical protein
MAYEGFMAFSDEGDLQHLDPVFISPNSAIVLTTGEPTANGMTAFVINCSRQDKAEIFITYLTRASIDGLVEDPDLIKALAGLMKRTKPSLGKLAPDDPRVRRFPFKSEEGVQQLVLRHVERPIEPVELDGYILAASVMN